MVGGGVVFALLLACASAPASPVPPVLVAAPPPLPVWPDPASLTVLPPVVVRTRVLLDAGHGAPGNSGNTNVLGDAEQAVMRRVTDGIASVMEADGVAVSRSRPDAALVDYDRRLALARAQDVLISLHSDARTGVRQGWVDPAAGTWWTEGARGFAVLWSDEGTRDLVDRRRQLAAAVARALAASGFLPYPGADYVGIYEADATIAGMFVDRHLPSQRIRLLRRPTVPSVIVETHEAHDVAEVARWDDAHTWAAAARAFSAALAEVDAARPLGDARRSMGPADVP